MGQFLAVVGTVVFCVVLVCGVVALGWWLAMQQVQAEQRRLRLQRDLLDTEWRTLDQARQVREVFLAARRAIQRVADDNQRRGGET